VFEAVGEDGGREGTITGYYEPEILAQPFASEGLIPVYSRPPELERVDPGLGLDFDYGHRDAEGRLEPFYSRAEIAQGALSGRGLELFWTRHPTDLMVLQTQGSGWALFPGGSRRRLSFDGANGHRFRSVGQRLIDCGLIAPGTDPIDILRYLRSRSPEREAELVNINPRYVFFASSESGAATGAAGVELVPGRSVAVDTRHLPLGLSAFLMSRRPVAGDDGRLEGQRDFSRFVFTHDVGSAIRGGVRLDLFWGAGPRAQAEAHRMWSPGKLWVLVLRPDALIN
ncbi:MAG: MltA domain-containing protein, partial [Elusimicrobia bacterium]|nr:MltA domain-containing protein [Elusimicrobiota bacterium]